MLPSQPSRCYLYRMGSDLAPVAPALPWWGILLVALIGPTGLGALVLKLGSSWVDRRHAETAAREAERKAREDERAEERKMLLALPTKIEGLTVEVKALGAHVVEVLAHVERVERERSDVDRVQREQFSRLMSAMSKAMGLEDGHHVPAPASSSPASTGVRPMMRSAPR